MPITRRSFTVGASLAAGALARPALADTSPILIGYPAALTGPSSAPGVGQNRGVTYIVDQINAAGGVNGRKIEIITRDTQGDPTKAVNAVQEMMANNKVHAIFGPNNSGEVTRDHADHHATRHPEHALLRHHLADRSEEVPERVPDLAE